MSEYYERMAIRLQLCNGFHPQIGHGRVKPDQCGGEESGCAVIFAQRVE
jgi:hypothetical protein